MPEVKRYVNRVDRYRDEDGILTKQAFYTDDHGVIHSFYYCEHCGKPIEYTHRCGDHLYCSTKCALEVLKEEMKTWKPKKVREIRMVSL